MNCHEPYVPVRRAPSSKLQIQSPDFPTGYADAERTKYLEGPTQGPVPTSTMHHFRKKSSSAVTPTNSPPPTPASPVVEYIKQELATFYPRAKDTRALAASSSAIALSIASPSSDPIDTSINEPGSSGESAWKTAYGAARIAVEIANASSDMFLPLKAVVGALSVLIKNYDVGPR